MRPWSRRFTKAVPVSRSADRSQHARPESTQWHNGTMAQWHAAVVRNVWWENHHKSLSSRGGDASAANEGRSDRLVLYAGQRTCCVCSLLGRQHRTQRRSPAVRRPGRAARWPSRSRRCHRPAWPARQPSLSSGQSRRRRWRRGCSRGVWSLRAPRSPAQSRRYLCPEDAKGRRASWQPEKIGSQSTAQHGRVMWVRRRIDHFSDRQHMPPKVR